MNVDRNREEREREARDWNQEVCISAKVWGDGIVCQTDVPSSTRQVHGGGKCGSTGVCIPVGKRLSERSKRICLSEE